MKEQPDAHLLLQAARDSLKDKVLPVLQGDQMADAKREVLMAINALSIAQRELQLDPSAEATERQSLSSLLGEPVDNLQEANRKLASHLRAGWADQPEARREAVLVHLRNVGKSRLQVSNPKVLKADRS